MGNWGKVTFIVFTIFILTTQGFAQDTFAMKKFDILIKVSDENDEPVPNAKCDVVSDPGSGIVVSGFTNNGGVAKVMLEGEISGDVDVTCSTDTQEASENVTLKKKGTTTVKLVLRVLACVPPTCPGTGDCGPNGTCVADDLCQCDPGFHGDLCTVPDCESNDECDDGNSCTAEVCQDGVCAVAPIPEGASCDDEQFCTTGDTCDGEGECRPGVPSCGGAPCDEVNDLCECNIIIDCAVGFIPADTDEDGCPDACVPVSCNDLVDCDDDNACTADFCREDLTCGHQEIEGCCTSNEQCSDNDVCTADFCRADGTCGTEIIPGCDTCTAPATCDDGEICTADFCSDAGICGHEPIAGCCTSDEQCPVSGVCDTNTGECSIPRCGDGVENQATEECDDGNQVDGDGCSSACQIESTCSASNCPTGCCSGDVCVDFADQNDAACGTGGSACISCSAGEVCSTTNGICTPTCVPSAEICNGVDDNCNGVVDEGIDVELCGNPDLRCISGACVPACVPSTEVCDGQDNDCDGTVDEELNLGTCTTACDSTGTQVCNGSSGISCNPPAEVCDGQDNDCDTEVDEDFQCVAGSTSTCNTSCGSVGTTTCNAACSLNACTPPAEVCTDGADNDCDGAVDSADPDCAVAGFCGDGITDPALGEACDDGNTVHGDGCSASCQVETLPLIETDLFDSVIGSLRLIPPTGIEENIALSGDLTIEALINPVTGEVPGCDTSNPPPNDTIQTEILSMSLSGTTSFDDPVLVEQSIFAPSTGIIRELENDVACQLDLLPFGISSSAFSSYETFLQVTIQTPNGDIRLFNIAESLNIESSIGFKPADFGDQFFSTNTVQLFDESFTPTGFFMQISLEPAPHGT